ncbi:MAG: monoamine oxidase [Thermoanaerobaculia bacterium]|jgi:monoamine oxidase|nr:monoamine oxidase [Thermoanaerobaculia bacterium]
MSESDSRGKWTRRRFLETVGRVGGAAAVYESMVALGMVRVPDSVYANTLQIPEGAGEGKTIVILGAGVAGLTAAYELQQRKSGYKIIILEAQHRPGGRSYTVRTGDKIVEKHGNDTWEQTCHFDKDQYLNAGPGRLPYHHTVALGYCRELKVAVEPYVMSSRANLYQNQNSFHNEALPNRRILNDTRGYIAELLTKSIDKGSLNDELSPRQKAQMLDLLNTFGPLTKKKYIGSQRSGYTTEPGVTSPGDIVAPLKLIDLLGSEFWLDRMYQPEDYEWQPTLFQPVGGMDMLAKGFLPFVGDLIQYNREVTYVHNVEKDQVEIHHRKAGDPASSVEKITADWCISTIPVWILANDIDNNFSKPFTKALKAAKVGKTCKVGWQANRRFWELDKQIYGGISYINHNITQMWYPSNGYLFQEKGVLTGAYNYKLRAEELGNQSLAQRLQTAAAGARRLHGDAFTSAVPIELGLSIAWHKVPYQMGGWADWDDVPAVYYETLLAPEGRVMVAGDQVSYLPGWQEGAMLSAQYVLNQIMPRETRMMKAAPSAKRAPSTRAMTEGTGRTRD